MDKFAYIDFEFIPDKTSVKLVCANLQYDYTLIVGSNADQDFWLLDDSRRQEQLKEVLEALRESDYTICAFYCPAEAQCFKELGLNPLDFKWIDSHIIGLPFYHSKYDYQTYVSQYYSKPEDHDPPVVDDDDEAAFTEDPVKVAKRRTSSLLGFYGYFCGVHCADLEKDKDFQRDRILGLADREPLDIDIKEIQEYCKQDVDILKKVVIEQYERWHWQAMRSRAELTERFINWTRFRLQMWDTSQNGLPLNTPVVVDYVNNYQKYIDAEMMRNPTFYEVVEPTYYKKDGKYGKKGQLRTPGGYKESYDKFVHFLCDNRLQDKWPRTDGGKFSRLERVLLDHVINPDIESYLACKKRVKQIQFFKPKGDTGIPKIMQWVTERREDWDHLGEDIKYWQHPEFGTFGTTTGRNAHKSASFIMSFERKLRPTLLGTPPGMDWVVADYSAQEVWIAGALSGDPNQLRSATEDPYLDFGKKCGLIPPEGTKHTHSKMRDICKAVVLAGFYGMGINTLEAKLKLPRLQVEQLYKWSRQYYEVFFRWQNDFLTLHKQTHYYELADGWPLFDNYDSFGFYKVPPAMNFPIQGMGAVIMRKVVDLLYENNLRLAYTLHDEFGILCYSQDKDHTKSLTERLMQEACTYYFPNHTPPRIGFK